MTASILLRPISFLAILLLMLLWEGVRPARLVVEKGFTHNLRNLTMLGMATALTRLVMPILPVAVAAWAESAQIGLLNAVSWPSTLEYISGFLLLDFLIYCQHVLFHLVPWLWRFHSMHHTDLDYTATTGIRFHPGEILLSSILKMAAIVTLGVSAHVVLVFEVILNGAALFNHGNVLLAPSTDRILSWFIVTPNIHRVHHSTIPKNFNSNFGFNSPWWDKLCGTYRHIPGHEQQKMTIGLPKYRDLKELTLIKLLILPFR